MRMVAAGSTLKESGYAFIIEPVLPSRDNRS